jgi:uncharacterized protein (TIGR02996 family)
LGDLERAAKCLAKNDDVGALEALLAAWRKVRSTRIADAIDRVSARLPHEPVRAPSVKARTAAWLALAKKKKAADVASLVATPWPGTWKDAVPVLEALRAIPADPRIAMALARIVEETPYDSFQTYKLYAPLVRHLAKLADRRTLPILERDLARTKSRGWREDVQPLLVEAVAKIAATPDVAPSAIAAVEAFFADAASHERAKAKGEADFLAAIYADPDDDTLRMVFADWLQERGDPRGELIALQLAAATPASQKKAASLVKQHGVAWAGRLHRFLAKEGRVFERGFLARGTLTLEGRPKELPPGLDLPEWATVHTLTFDWDVNRDRHAAAILALPSMQHLRGIGAGLESVVTALPERPRLEELEIELFPMRDETDELLAERRRIAEGNTFPALRRLGIDGEVDRAKLLIAGKLGKRLEQVTLFNTDLSLGPFVRLVDELGLKNVTEVRVVYRLRSVDDMWRLTMRRDANGRFTILHGVAHRAQRGIGKAGDLADALETLEPHELTAIAIDKSVPCRYDASDIERVERALARFPKLASVDVPWDRIAAGPSADPSAIPLFALLIGKQVTPESLGAVWDAVHEPPLSLVLDSYAVNMGAHAPLPKDAPLDHAAKLLGQKRTKYLSLYAKASRERSKVVVHRGRLEVSSVLVPGDAPAYLDWLLRTCDKLGITDGHVAFVEKTDDGWERRPHLHWLEPRGETLAWVLILDPKHDAEFPFAKLEKLPRRKDLSWLRAVRTKHALALVFADSPLDIPTEARITAFEAALDAVRKKRT